MIYDALVAVLQICAMVSAISLTIMFISAGFQLASEEVRHAIDHIRGIKHDKED